MKKLINQYVEGDYIIYEFENGTIVKTHINQETENETIELPKNPLIELQQENAELKARIEIMQQALDDLLLGGGM